MSTNKHTNPAYISHVHLKGYKSIIDTEVELHPGLNIIIGPNGSGKTNFLEFLKRIITRNLPKDTVEFYLEIVTKKEKQIWEGYVNEPKENPKTQEFEIIVSDRIYSISQKKPKFKSNYHSHYGTVIYGDKKLHDLLPNFYPISFISFSIPKTISGLTDNINLTINKKNFKASLADLDLDSSIKFIGDFILNNFYYKKLSPEILSSKDNILNDANLSEVLIRNLNKFSPIKNLRLESGLSVKENGLAYYINHINFEFFVNENWINWNMMSDGTKRLFYLISEVTLKKGLCFIEEPEIGVHPNQYRRILNFLKEQSEDKQIIITTHAPKTLDILNDSELDRIILTRYDNLLGTKMRHLNKEEIKHAVKYMLKESLFLSDFWTLTSFFDEEEII
ncbi:MAG: AAA family ATPase [Saprospiraceae bacterium]